MWHFNIYKNLCTVKPPLLQNPSQCRLNSARTCRKGWRCEVGDGKRTTFSSKSWSRSLHNPGNRIQFQVQTSSWSVCYSFISLKVIAFIIPACWGHSICFLILSKLRCATKRPSFQYSRIQFKKSNISISTQSFSHTAENVQPASAESDWDISYY